MARLSWLLLGLASLLCGALGVAAVQLALATLGYVSEPALIVDVSGIALYQQVGAGGEERVSARTRLYEGDRITLSGGSTAKLRLFDSSLIELSPDAQLRVDRMRTARLPGFQPEVRLIMDRGAARLTVAPDGLDSRAFSVVTPGGVGVLTGGEYTVRVGQPATRISVWQGKATVQVDGQVVDVLPERKIILPGEGTFVLADALENILLNGSFSDGFRVGWSEWEQQEGRLVDERGTRDIVFPTEPGAPARALKLSRRSVNDTHNETGVKQEFKWDVSGSRAVSFDMRLKIDSASLSGGGYLGTEYPVMVRIRYQSSVGSEHVWTRGFYYANPEQRPVSSSQIDSVLVQRGAWRQVHYDLLKELSVPPAVIEEIQVLAAGHSFDSYVADLAILVD